ncbi:MAG: T9SS type A sorting domain-containing protein [Clostridiales bacterium]
MKKYILLFVLIITIKSYSYNAVLFNGTSSLPWEKLVVKTLAGIVNRDSSRLYLMNVYETWSYSKTDESWADIYRTKGEVKFDTAKSVSALIDRFRSFLKGAISYDPNQYFSNFTGQSFQWQAEVAAMLGGLTDRLPLTKTQASAFNLQLNDSVLVDDSFDGDKPVYVTGRLEDAVHLWNTISFTDEQKYLSILDWGIKFLLPRCNPSKFYIREFTDYSVQKKMFQVNLGGTGDLKFETLSDKRADIIERILIYLHSKNPTNIFHIYGWMRPEPLIQWFAFYGASFHETLLANLSWHSSFPVEQKQYKRASIVNADTLKLSEKYYLLFIGTEGDAANWNFGLQSGAWLSSERGKVPIGWGWNLELMNECPFVARYYFDSATPNDGFISVTSPLGYTYPDLWGNDVWQKAVDSSHYLMNKFNVFNIYAYKHYANGEFTYDYRGKAIDNSFNFTRLGQFQKEIGADITFTFDPKLQTQSAYTNYGALIFNHVDDGTFYGDVSNLPAAANRILATLKTKTKPFFMLAGYQRLRQDDMITRTDPELADITIGRLKQMTDLIKEDPSVGKDVEIVTPEVFSALLRKKLGIVNVDKEGSKPSGFILSQNYPNPFNPSTVIEFFVPFRTNVKLTVYDILGKEIKTLLEKQESAGKHSVRFNAADIPAGVYVYRLIAGSYTESKKMLVVK